MSRVIRQKLKTIACVTVFLVAFAVTVGEAVGAPLDVAVTMGFVLGFLIVTFEEFYFQGQHGAWMRLMRPIHAIPIYAAVVCALFFAVQHFAFLVTGRINQIPEAYERYPITIPALFVFATLGVLALRIVGFIGGRNLIDLLIGRYMRPVTKCKVLLFLDMKASTAMVEALGDVRAKAFIGKFLFDISRPVTEHGGDIYLYTGDGLIAMWDWDDALSDNTIIAAVDAIHAVILREKANYEREFRRVPEFRIGIHGGDVVMSEQGDTRRAIGVYGDTINIAARLEQTAKELDIECVFSTKVVEALSSAQSSFEPLREVTVRGISEPVPIQSYAITH